MGSFSLAGIYSRGPVVEEVGPPRGEDYGERSLLQRKRMSTGEEEVRVRVGGKIED